MAMVSSAQVNPSSSSSITIGNVTGWLENEHTLCLSYDGSEITMDDVRNSEEIRDTLVAEKPIYVLAEMPNVKRTSPETRRHAPHPNTRKIAVVYASPVGRMLGNVFLRLKGSKYPTRLFGDRQKALEWFEDSGPPAP